MSRYRTFGRSLSDADGTCGWPIYTRPYSGTPPRSAGVPTRWRVLSPTGEWIGVVNLRTESPSEILAIRGDPR